DPVRVQPRCRCPQAYVRRSSLPTSLQECAPRSQSIGVALRTSVLAVLLLLLPYSGANAEPAAATCDLSGTPTSSAFLPNITKNLGGVFGWVTPFIVQNVGTTATDLQVSFYKFSDGSLVTCRKIAAVRPGASFADIPNNDADLPVETQFSV